MSKWCSRAVNTASSDRPWVLVVHGPAHLARSPGSGSGTGWALPRSPWSAAFPPRSPSALPCLRSTASLVLCHCATPFRRARGTYRSSPSPTDPPLTGCEWLQGLSVLAREVSMHACGLRLRRACDALAISRTPQCCLPVRLTPLALLVLAFSELTISGYPAYMCPCPTLQVRGCAHRPHMARGQDGFAIPFLYDFSGSSGESVGNLRPQRWN